MAGLLAYAMALAAQWIAVGERIAAAIWDWYKFRGFGGGTAMTVGRETQLVFYTLGLAFAGIALAIARTSRNSRLGNVATFEAVA